MEEVGQNQCRPKEILMIYKISGKLSRGLTRQKVNFVASVCPDHHEQSEVLVVVCWSRPASGPGWPAVIDGTNTVVYHKILKQNLNSWLPSQEQFGYAAGQRPETTGPPLNENKINVFEWPGESPDLNLMELLWWDLQQLWIERVAKVPPHWETIIRFHQLLTPVILVVLFHIRQIGLVFSPP